MCVHQFAGGRVSLTLLPYVRAFVDMHMQVYIPDEEFVWLPAVVNSVSGSEVSAVVESVHDAESGQALAKVAGEVRTVNLADKAVSGWATFTLETAERNSNMSGWKM